MKIRKSKELSDGHISVQDSVLKLVTTGVIDREVRFPDQVVKKLLNTGEIMGNKPPQNQPKWGWEVNEQSLNEYIEVGTMSPSQLRKELLAAKREIKEIKETGVKKTSSPKQKRVEIKEGATALLVKDVIDRIEKGEKTTQIYGKGSGLNVSKDTVARKMKKNYEWDNEKKKWTVKPGSKPDLEEVLGYYE